MIVPSEIIENDIVKVLVNEDGVEDEMYGIVGMNTGNTIGLRYLNPTELFYKSACVYELEHETLSPVPYESLMEHYPSGTRFEDLEMKALGIGQYVMYAEIDVEDTDSDIHDEGGDDESDLEGFVVSDSEIIGQDIPLPPGHQAIDREWNAWEPTTSGGKSFKETVDMIETNIRHLSTSA
tara:strand:+ start:572 stop:1111 length:540 start_codon:yes stop_codon:yes gene_type:complete